MPEPSSQPRETLAHYVDEFRGGWNLSRWEDFLSELPPKGSPLRASVLLEVTRLDMEYRYREGNGLFVEQYLALTPELGTFETIPTVLIETEMRLRRQFDQQLPLTEILDRFPNRIETIQAIAGELSTGKVGDGVAKKRSVAKFPKTRLDPANLPENFGHYRILRQLGAGGMGWVYLARDTRMDRLVALKVPRFSGTNEKKTIHRFYQEVRAAAALQHPNICSIYDVNQIEEVPFMTMRYIEGKTLASLIRPGKRWPEKESVQVIRRLAVIVHAAHLKGVVHRDLKPTNVMLSDDKELIVMDFGLAVQTDSETDRLTRTGSPLGTPAYMSPEQAQGERDRIGPWSDVYSLGVMLYELLLGRRPFIGNTAVVMVHHILTPPPPLREQRPSLSTHVERVCLKAMAKTPEGRYPSAKAFADALYECLKAVGERREDSAPASGAPNVTGSQGQVVDLPLEIKHTPQSARNVNASDRKSEAPSGASASISNYLPATFEGAASSVSLPAAVVRDRKAWLVPVAVSLLVVILTALMVLLLK
jgi:serine/threonine protein kinase